MKISIWQQFSSNHSASYTVVAKFKSVEEAENIAEKLRKIVEDIRLTEPIRDESTDKAVYHPTDVEKKIGKKYGFEWQHGVDWMGWRNLWDNIPVNQYRDTVWFDNPHLYSWQAPTEIVMLLQHMGADYVVARTHGCHGVPSMPDACLLVDFHFIIKDSDKADALYNHVKEDFDFLWELNAIGISYDTSLGIAIDYDVLDWQFKNQVVELFKIKRDNSKFTLHGIKMDVFDTYDVSLRQIVDFLEQAGAEDVTYRFYAEEVISYDSDEDDG